MANISEFIAEEVQYTYIALTGMIRSLHEFLLSFSYNIHF